MPHMIMEDSQCLLDKWERQLHNGINGRRTCPYDIQNLDYSGRFLLASLTKDHRNKCHNYYDETHPSGLKVLKFIVKNSLMKTSSKQRELISKVESYKLWDQEHEDVELFCVKLNNVCKQVCLYGQASRDL